MTASDMVLERKIIAIVRGLEPACMTQLAQALCRGGIDMMEITFQQVKPETWAQTIQAIRAVSEKMGGSMCIGAGTVLTSQQLRMAAEAGARYIVTPNTNPALIREAKAMGLCAFPGAVTPTEIVEAYAAGADAVKVFPAGTLGPGYIKAILAPLSHIPLLAVGGVNEHNAADFMAAGCCGVGVGGNLVNKDWIKDGAWDRIADLAACYRRSVDHR